VRKITRIPIGIVMSAMNQVLEVVSRPENTEDKNSLIVNLSQISVNILSELNTI